MDGPGSTETKRATGGGLAEVGAILRQRREEVGQDIAAISATTHIRQYYLKAIEEGRRKDLPGTAYMIGYIRTYADYLGFDGDRLIADFHDELAGPRKWDDKRAEPVEPKGVSLPQVQISPAILMAGLLVLGIAGYVAWGYFTAPDEKPAQTASTETPAEPASPENPAPATQPTAAQPTAAPATPSPTGAEASAPPDAPATDTTASGTSAAQAPAAAAAPAEEAPAADDQVPPEAEVASTGEQVIEESPPQPQAAAAADAKAGKIVLRARLESWVQVTNAKKEVLFSRVLRSGETYTVPEEKGLMLTTGNAGGLEIIVSGTKLKSFGSVGLVKRDIPLDAKKLKDGSAFKTSTNAPAAD